MFWFIHEGDPDWMLMGGLLSLMTGALCGAGTLAVGLTRGHRTLGWTGFGFCILVGFGCFLLALLPAGALIAIMLLTEPIEKTRRRKRTVGPRAWADHDYSPSYGTRSHGRAAADPPPKVRPAPEVDETPEIVDELPFEDEPSAPVPAVHLVLAEIRAKLGPPPRWFSEDVLNAWTVRRPDRVGSDELEIILRDQRAVLAMGEVFWGVLVRANPALFRPGPLDHPADLIYSRDPAVVRDPARLVAVAKRVSELKDTEPATPALRKFADLLSDDRRRALRWEVPESLTAGLSVYLTAVLVSRAHLPGRMLVGRPLPVLVRYDTPAALLVPSALWPPAFRTSWEAEARKAAAARPWLTIMPAAAEYLKRRAVTENVSPPWAFRMWIERDVDRANARIETSLGPLVADPVYDRPFQGGGLVVVIPRAQEEEFRGVEIDVVKVQGGEQIVVV